MKNEIIKTALITITTIALISGCSERDEEFAGTYACENGGNYTLAKDGSVTTNRDYENATWTNEYDTESGIVSVKITYNVQGVKPKVSTSLKYSEIWGGKIQWNDGGVPCVKK